MGELYEIWFKMISEKKEKYSGHCKISLKPFSFNEAQPNPEKEGHEPAETLEEDVPSSSSFVPKELEPDFYDMVEDNPHYKNIYYFGMGKFQSNWIVITIGIDRRVCFWLYNPVGLISIDWSIDCLGGKVYKLALSPSEKSNVLSACSDGSLRVWNTEKKNNRFFTINVWKGLSNKTFSKIAFHPTDSALVAYSTDSGQRAKSKKTSGSIPATVIGLYHLFSQTGLQSHMTNRSLEVDYLEWLPLEAVRLMSSKVFVEEITKMGHNKLFLRSPFLKKTESNSPNSPQKNQTKLSWKSNQSGKQPLDEKYALVFFIKGSGFHVLNASTGKIMALVPGSEWMGQAIDVVYLKEQKRVVIGSGNQHGVVCFASIDSGLRFSFKIFSTVHTQFISTLSFSLIGSSSLNEPGSVLCAAGSFDRKISLYSVPVDFNREEKTGEESDSKERKESETVETKDSQNPESIGKSKEAKATEGEEEKKSVKLEFGLKEAETIQEFFAQSPEVKPKKEGFCDQIENYEKLTHKYRILSVSWSPLTFGLLLNTCERHSTVQIWDCRPWVFVKEPKNRQKHNIRGHRGNILDASFSNHDPFFVISSSFPHQDCIISLNG